MSIENNELNENVEETEVEETEIEVPSNEDPILKDMVARLKKQAKIDVKTLEGKSLKEQYSLLAFLLDNKPKTKRTNKPVLPGVMTDNYNPKQFTNFEKTGNGIKWTVPTNELWKKQT